VDELIWNFKIPEEFVLQKTFLFQEIEKVEKNNKKEQYKIVYKN
jgi:hypothetical protein